MLGKFTEDFVREDKLTDDKRFDTTGVLRQYFENLGVPVLVNFPIGHYPQNCTVPLGGEVEIDADAKTLRSWLLRFIQPRRGAEDARK